MSPQIITSAHFSTISVHRVWLGKRKRCSLSTESQDHNSCYAGRNGQVGEGILEESNMANYGNQHSSDMGKLKTVSNHYDDSETSRKENEPPAKDTQLVERQSSKMTGPYNMTATEFKTTKTSQQSEVRELFVTQASLPAKTTDSRLSSKSIVSQAGLRCKVIRPEPPKPSCNSSVLNKNAPVELHTDTLRQSGTATHMASTQHSDAAKEPSIDSDQSSKTR